MSAAHRFPPGDYDIISRSSVRVSYRQYLEWCGIRDTNAFVFATSQGQVPYEHEWSFFYKFVTGLQQNLVGDHGHERAWLRILRNYISRLRELAVHEDGQGAPGDKDRYISLALCSTWAYEDLRAGRFPQPRESLIPSNAATSTGASAENRDAAQVTGTEAARPVEKLKEYILPKHESSRLEELERWATCFTFHKPWEQSGSTQDARAAPALAKFIDDYGDLVRSRGQAMPKVNRVTSYLEKVIQISAAEHRRGLQDSGPDEPEQTELEKLATDLKEEQAAHKSEKAREKESSKAAQNRLNERGDELRETAIMGMQEQDKKAKSEKKRGRSSSLSLNFDDFAEEDPKTTKANEKQTKRHRRTNTVDDTLTQLIASATAEDVSIKETIKAMTEREAEDRRVLAEDRRVQAERDAEDRRLLAEERRVQAEDRRQAIAAQNAVIAGLTALIKKDARNN